MNSDTFTVSSCVSFNSTSLLNGGGAGNRGQLVKERIHSFKSRLYLEELRCTGKQPGSHKMCFLSQKMAEKFMCTQII